ncbi:MAG: TolC family protein [Betaproteobacteria bacterium]|nr:TolC family protein [Betaproteobacteria bacterium]
MPTATTEGVRPRNPPTASTEKCLRHHLVSQSVKVELSQQALTLNSLFDPANRTWSLGGSLLAPIFEGGTLQAQRQAAVEAYKASLATYEQTVLQGLQQVADSLQALHHDAQTVSAQQDSSDIAAASLDLQRASYKYGKGTVLSLISAQRS